MVVIYFKISRNGKNLVSRPGDQNTYKHGLLSRRVIAYWNKLPLHIRSVKTVDAFKNNLRNFKTKNLTSPGHYWELSDEIFQRIPNNDRTQYVTFMQNNPQVARCRRVNININGGS